MPVAHRLRGCCRRLRGVQAARARPPQCEAARGYQRCGPAPACCSRSGGCPLLAPASGSVGALRVGGLEGCESDAGPQAKQRGMAAHGQTAITLYSVSNYNFGTKEAKVEKDVSVQDRLLRMQRK